MELKYKIEQAMFLIEDIIAGLENTIGEQIFEDANDEVISDLITNMEKVEEELTDCYKKLGFDSDIVDQD